MSTPQADDGPSRPLPCIDGQKHDEEKKPDHMNPPTNNQTSHQAASPEPLLIDEVDVKPEAVDSAKNELVKPNSNGTAETFECKEPDETPELAKSDETEESELAFQENIDDTVKPERKAKKIAVEVDLPGMSMAAGLMHLRRLWEAGQADPGIASYKILYKVPGGPRCMKIVEMPQPGWMGYGENRVSRGPEPGMKKWCELTNDVKVTIANQYQLTRRSPEEDASFIQKMGLSGHEYRQLQGLWPADTALVEASEKSKTAAGHHSEYTVAGMQRVTDRIDKSLASPSQPIPTILYVSPEDAEDGPSFLSRALDYVCLDDRIDPTYVERIPEAMDMSGEMSRAASKAPVEESIPRDYGAQRFTERMRREILNVEVQDYLSIGQLEARIPGGQSVLALRPAPIAPGSGHGVVGKSGIESHDESDASDEPKGSSEGHDGPDQSDEPEGSSESHDGPDESDDFDGSCLEQLQACIAEHERVKVERWLGVESTVNPQELGHWEQEDSDDESSSHWEPNDYDGGDEVYRVVGESGLERHDGFHASYESESFILEPEQLGARMTEGERLLALESAAITLRQEHWVRYGPHGESDDDEVVGESGLESQDGSDASDEFEGLTLELEQLRAQLAENERLLALEFTAMTLEAGHGEQDSSDDESDGQGVVGEGGAEGCDGSDQDATESGEAGQGGDSDLSAVLARLVVSDKDSASVQSDVPPEAWDDWGSVGA